jgi:hypothetical protein
LNNKNEKEEPRNDDGGVMMDHSTLHLPTFTSRKVVTVSDHVQATVDNILLDPRRPDRAPISESPNAPYDTVNDRAIEPVKDRTQTFEGFYKGQVV